MRAAVPSSSRSSASWREAVSIISRYFCFGWPRSPIRTSVWAKPWIVASGVASRARQATRGAESWNLLRPLRGVTLTFPHGRVPPPARRPAGLPAGGPARALARRRSGRGEGHPPPVGRRREAHLRPDRLHGRSRSAAEGCAHVALSG